MNCITIQHCIVGQWAGEKAMSRYNYCIVTEAKRGLRQGCIARQPKTRQPSAQHSALRHGACAHDTALAAPTIWRPAPTTQPGPRPRYGRVPATIRPWCAAMGAPGCQLGQFWCSCTWLSFRPGFWTQYSF